MKKPKCPACGKPMRRKTHWVSLAWIFPRMKHVNWARSNQECKFYIK